MQLDINLGVFRNILSLLIALSYLIMNSNQIWTDKVFVVVDHYVYYNHDKIITLTCIIMVILQIKVKSYI